MIVLLEISMALTLGLTVGGMLLSMTILYILLIVVLFKKVKPGQALIRTGMGPQQVSLKNMWVVPFLHRADWVDLTVKKIPIAFSNRDPLQFRNGGKAQFEAAGFIRVNPERNAIQQVASWVSPEATFSQEKIEHLFQDQFLSAIKEAARNQELEFYLNDQLIFKKDILNILGEDFNGFGLEDFTIKQFNKM